MRLALAIALLLPACSSLDQAPDPIDQAVAAIIAQ
jgi:hypothetical protein